MQQKYIFWASVAVMLTREKKKVTVMLCPKNIKVYFQLFNNRRTWRERMLKDQGKQCENTHFQN